MAGKFIELTNNYRCKFEFKQWARIDRIRCSTKCPTHSGTIWKTTKIILCSNKSIYFSVFIFYYIFLEILFIRNYQYLFLEYTITFVNSKHVNTNFEKSGFKTQILKIFMYKYDLLLDCFCLKSVFTIFFLGFDQHKCVFNTRKHFKVHR